MATVLFVHGTGVRKASYLEAFALIRNAFHDHAIFHDLQPCLWGDDLGSKAPLDSVPGLVPPGNSPAIVSEQQELARWDLLYGDPLFELRLLKNRPRTGPALPPTAPRPDIALWERLAVYRPTPVVLTFLQRWKIDQDWHDAWNAVVVDDKSAFTILHQSPGEIGEPGQAVARAVVAGLIIRALADERPLLDAKHRDELVNLLIDDWKARVAGIGNFLMNFVADVAASIATPIVNWKRGKISAGAAAPSGDILLYQTRGNKIRRYIRESIEKQSGDVILLAHSLGGIACLDLLATTSLPQVTHLITAGSQSSLLYEIGALPSLDSKEGERLRTDFPKWLNIYDPYDFLSYTAELVFKLPQVKDVKVESGQPFPHSHGAYWTNDDTWRAIRDFLQ
ncbi:MAG: hypothetical protein H7Y20_02305 [Bryobacteraceae bacterium]|nr:hypothetical protein [Bryobacteraceae bacterium]